MSLCSNRKGKGREQASCLVTDHEESWLAGLDPKNPKKLKQKKGWQLGGLEKAMKIAVHKTDSLASTASRLEGQLDEIQIGVK